ncbi:LysR family transcriptional regulator [Janthinobacterium agaricidamnosum]|uniref:Bacterial regulatory helix-turn-helix, lysR family protein n=1 Tax=Janthinobacterium agaricidamnosum NBRC 102515 = DSM 9628 TaxID=1349767 RepID=W0V6X4_9BURK|nr:LysR family transcriptional regulator [Janthinobacterium agaricidamnosum]CDG83631.1 bacterial regulatory helix-turn-helix, lysR family protein [Janthinobacterium agaricidamnosum NBRC 102515 = DSM 9628]
MDRLDALKVFCAVVESGGFSKAAGKLGISTSSVTNQVAALEQHFHARLLNRTTRSMSLTDEGRQCHQHALRLLGDMAELESSLQQAAGTPSGGLRVDLPSSISRNLVAPALPRFLAAYPGIKLRLTVSDRMIDMVEEGVDVMVRIGDLADSSLVARCLLKMEYICCASPDFVARHGAPDTPDDLARLPCLNFLYPKSRQVRQWMFRHDGAHGGQPYPQTPPGIIDFDHIESMITAAQAGCGIVQALSVSVLEPIRDGTLLPLLPAWRSPGPDVSVLTQARHHRAAKVKVFVDFLAELFQKVA